MESHKKVLGILYIVSGALLLFVIFFLSMFVTTILSLVAGNLETHEAAVVDLIARILQFLPAVIIIFFSIPSIIAGIGLLYQQKWAMILALILGCFKLFSFPIGTALGIYTIWVYAEDQKVNSQNN